MREQSFRNLQMGEQIKRTLSNMFTSDLVDKNLVANISITEVSMTGGLKQANIFISGLSKEETIEKANELNNHKNEIRFELAKHIKTRYIPTLFFEPDLASFYAEKINKILNSANVKKDLN